MKITITRAFERTKQIAQYEPIKAFCAASVEYELAGQIEPATSADEMSEMSTRLDTFVRGEVEKTIQQALDAGKECRVCGGIQRYGGKGLDDEGRCASCAADHAAKVREFKKGNTAA